MSKELHERIDTEYRETQRLLRRAWRLGIEVPNDRSWWDDDDEINIEAGVGFEELELVGRRWLNEEGKARLMFRIEQAEAS